MIDVRTGKRTEGSSADLSCLEDLPGHGVQLKGSEQWFDSYIPPSRVPRKVEPTTAPDIDPGSCL
jgi:hypothetical protein